MKLFIWEDVSGLTENYHDSGGLVIIAESLKEARRMVDESSDRDAKLRKEHAEAYKKLCEAHRPIDRSDPTAQKAWTDAYIKLQMKYPDGCLHAEKGCVNEVKPTATYEVGEVAPRLFVFPDAGCC